MKRILLEISGGLAVLVLLASFHSQISRLKLKDDEVRELKILVRSTVAQFDSQNELNTRRAKVTGDLEAKFALLEAKVEEAHRTSVDSIAFKAQFKAQLGETQREAELFKAQLKRDISRTQEIVDAYHEEMRSHRSSDNAILKRTRDDLVLLATHIRRDPGTLSRELLRPAVQLNGDDTVGSGTLIFSGKRGKGKSKKYETYIITSYHVIRNILADTPRAKREGIAVTIYHSTKKKSDYRGDMIAHDSRIDAALIKLRSDQKFDHVARVISKRDADEVRGFDEVYAVGCPLGNDPIPSQGEVSSLRNELNGANYWMINAPTYFGNSGGGVFMADTRELLGVFSKIYTHGHGNPVVIPHMGLFTPMPQIYQWLEKENLAFVLENETVVKRDPRLESLLSPTPK